MEVSGGARRERPCSHLCNFSVRVSSTTRKPRDIGAQLTHIQVRASPMNSAQQLASSQRRGTVSLPHDVLLCALMKCSRVLQNDIRAAVKSRLS